MRTALILLFLLALASIPGSVIPQRNLNPLRVQRYFDAHKDLAPVLDRFSLFNVFSAPWFAAIYLLLFLSLAGCVIPRSWQHAKAMRARPPAPPRRLDRLPQTATWQTGLERDAAYAELRTALRRKRFRVDVHGTALAAEKGYLRETGNLVFHLALLLILIGVALGSLYGYKATRLVIDGKGFANTVGSYDSWKPGRYVKTSSLAPFTIQMDRFEASYIDSGPKAGQAETFVAHVRYRSQPGSSWHTDDIRVNHPLTFGTTKVYLVGHGYAPRFTVRDDDGQVVFQGPVPFLPTDGNFGSTGVIKVPDARPKQLGFSGFFLPTAVPSAQGFVSIFPGAKNPAVVLLGYRGDLGLDSGRPQSVYALDDRRLDKVATAALGVGDTMVMPGGKGSITFTGIDQWASFQVTYDPGKRLVLIATVVMIVGLLLSLRVRRRRVWVRADRDEAGRTVIEAGGLGRSDSGAFVDEFADLIAQLKEVTPPPAATTKE
ncbi:MAG: cytochrome c biosis protein [Frankiales bacterium]|jgi:cytochrome c biogenesis protein|nr:cytochrome c biosis protein [Frankiales bacterium]